jgi:hypothetical protein
MIAFDYGSLKEQPVDKEVQDKANAILKQEMAEKLAPCPQLIEEKHGDGYATFYTVCPKCGMRIGAVTYHAETERQPEHLSWSCACGYIHKTRTAESK